MSQGDASRGLQQSGPLLPQQLQHLCALHPEVPAVDACTRCGAFTCGACITSRAGQALCVACVRWLPAPPVGLPLLAPVAVAASVLGLLGLFPLSVVGLVLGRRLGRAVEVGGAPEAARPWARVAAIAGWVGLVLGVFATLLFAMVLLMLLEG